MVRNWTGSRQILKLRDDQLTMSDKKPVDKRPIRDLLQEKDAFLTTSEKVYEYFLRHAKVFIVAAVAVAVCILALAVYVRYQKSAEAESTLAFEKALDLAVNQSSDLTAGLAALEQVRTDFPGRKGSRLAAFSLVNLYVSKNQVDQARPLAENLLQTLKPSEISLKPLLLNLLGGLYESGGDLKSAGTSYEAILALNNLEPALRMETLMALGRVNVAAGRQDQAIECFQTVVKDFPQTFRAYMANVKIAELKGEVEPFPLPAPDPSILTLNTKAEAPSDDTAVSESPAAEVVESGKPPAGAANDEETETAPGEEDLSENAPAGE